MLFDVIEIIAIVLSCLAASAHFVHVFQLERYQIPVYSQWLARGREHYFQKHLITGAVASVARWYLPFLLALFSAVEATRNAVAGWLTLIGYMIAVSILVVRDARLPMKKPLAFTMRVRRLFGALTLLYVVVVLVLWLLHIPPYLAYVTIPYSVWLAVRIMHPVEEKINAGFYAEAQAKLDARPDLIKIGITGSSGKTLTKFILKEILSEKYEVLATPASYNTAMGISRVVNDQLEDKHQVFIAEMGAQHVGDIKHLVKLVKPKYGMITSIGDRHLDSFGSKANIVDTKYELIDGLPEDGVAFFASDTGYADRLFAKCPREKYNVTVDMPGDHYMHADNMTYAADGLRFRLKCADGGCVDCHTQLLGRYNVQNIALAAALAHRLGMTMEEIAAGVARLQPFESRLELIPGERTVIDDTLNESRLGVAEALNVLAEFPGRRIIVTPGLPKDSARDDEDDENRNYAFGVQMKDCADVVILVREKKRMRVLRNGMISAGFSKSMIYLAADMNDAGDMLDEISESGDTVLYECGVRE